jgi:hypothetical protein
VLSATSKAWTYVPVAVTLARVTYLLAVTRTPCLNPPF